MLGIRNLDLKMDVCFFGVARDLLNFRISSYIYFIMSLSCLAPSLNDVVLMGRFAQLITQAAAAQKTKKDTNW